MTELSELRAQPNALARHYRRFRVDERLLLSGHSHQAWPDTAADGLDEAFEDAALLVDEKWERAFEKADEVRAGFARLLDDPAAEIVLAGSTHDLVVRLLSALRLRDRPRIVTTDGEFHTLRRQLGRLSEEGVEVVWVPSRPTATLAERMAAELDSRTSVAFVSAVMFETAAIVPGLRILAAACERAAVELVVDVYHALGPVPISVPADGLEQAWILGGGYKYLQLGEGNCFLRLPPQASAMRPVLTGWFAEFDQLDVAVGGGAVGYGRGAARFAGSTYDPSSHYRAARVFPFFERYGLNAGFLRTVAEHQVGLLAAHFDDLDLDRSLVSRDRSVGPAELGGFLALRSPCPSRLQLALRDRGVHTDSRGEYLRLGPAPYLCDSQLEAAIAALGESVRELERCLY